MTIFTLGFTGPQVYDGDTITASHAGFTFKATIVRDDDHGAPWEECDGHGPVSEWRSTDSKRPGERILCVDRGMCRFYDWEAAIKLAHKDGWGVKGGQQPDETLRQYRERAVQWDFDYLQGWCDDKWYYVGVDVSVSKDNTELVEAFEHALWGIDSTSPEYCTEVANELAEEALKTAQDRLLALCAHSHEPEDGRMVMEIIRADERAYTRG